jgi:hypothetical protein
MPKYDINTAELIRNFFKSIDLQGEKIFKRQELYDWFKIKYPERKRGNLFMQLTKLTVNAPSRKYSNPHTDGSDDLLYQIDTETFRLYDKKTDNPKPPMKQNDFENVINKLTIFNTPEHRYSSFDYCYNYFFTTEELTNDIEKSCFELAFYLASWGMFRGSSFLLQKSAKYFVKTIEYINSLDKNIWELDVNKYDDINIDKLIEIYRILEELIIENEARPITLITKIMLGIFGFVPAYDNYFCKTFKELTKGKCSFNSFNKISLITIKEFYDYNETTINKLSNKIFTYDFLTGKSTNIKYPKAKIIDMYGFAYSSR